jgi:hypothetical protein
MLFAVGFVSCIILVVGSYLLYEQGYFDAQQKLNA